MVFKTFVENCNNENIIISKFYTSRRLLPIVKSYVLKIPEFPEKYFHWKEEIMKIIIENQIVFEDDLDAHKIEKRNVPWTDCWIHQAVYLLFGI